MMAKRKRTEKKSSAQTDQGVLDLARAHLSSADFDALLRELEQPVLPSFRLNPLKLNEAEFKALTNRYGWSVKAVPFAENGYWLTDADTPFSRTIEHRLGFYYIQEAASMLPPSLFDMPAGSPQLILDMAASPGGKTTHLIDRAPVSSLIIANDFSESRLTALRLVLANWGAANVAVTPFPGDVLGSWFPEVFDLVLLDAPCSMQGLRSSESHAVRPITGREIKQLAGRQARLLASALEAVKTGGQVVYSTCTLTAEENEGVLQSMLEKYGHETISIEDISGKLTAPANSLAVSADADYASEIRRAARLWPHRFGTAGFFAALLTKRKPLSVNPSEPANRPFARTGLELLRGNRLRELLLLIEDQFGISLADDMEHSGLLLAQRGTRLFLLPERWIEQFSTLPFHSLGLMIGELDASGLDPSLDLLSRTHRQASQSGYTLPSELLPAWLRGEDQALDLTNTYPAGRVIAVYDEQQRLVGKGKVTRKRLKNHLPARFVQGLA